MGGGDTVANPMAEGMQEPRQIPPRRRPGWLRYGAGAVVLVAVYLAVSTVPLPLSNPPEDEETLEDLPPLVMHWHVQLNITVRGEPRLVSAPIGLASGIWVDHSLDEFGFPGASPLHTHSPTGRVHIESNAVRDYTLTEFFAIWGQPLGPDRLRDAVVGPGEEIVMVIDGDERPLDSGLVFQDEMQIVLILRTAG